jgi:multidrug efflux system membrane fusion protein
MDERTNRTKAEQDRKPALYTHFQPEAPAKTRSGVRLFIGLVVLAVLAFLAYRIVQTMQTVPPPTGRFVQTGPQPVGAATIGTGNIRVIVNALGTVTPLATVTVRTQINGQLTEVGFKEGQAVKKGDFLAQVDPRPYQLLQAQYEGQLAHDEGLLNQARADLVRYQNLLKQDSIARQQAENQVYVVQQYEGTVKTDQALIDQQKLNITYTHIVAPVDGRVGLRLVDPGNYVQTSDTNGIAVITRLQPISVVFSIPEDNLPPVMSELRAGTTLTVTAFDRANVHELGTGQLSTTDNQIDTTTGTVRLRAQFENQDETLFPNQFVNVQLLVKTLQGVVTVPTSAVQRGAPGTYVYVIKADNTVAVRPVTLGTTDGDMVEVQSGLAPGERVVVDGADRLRDGARVTSPADGGGGAAAPAGAGGETPRRQRSKKGQ